MLWSFSCKIFPQRGKVQTTQLHERTQEHYKVSLYLSCFKCILLVFENPTKPLWWLPGFQAGLTNFRTNNYEPEQHFFLRLQNDRPGSVMLVQGGEALRRSPSTWWGEWVYHMTIWRPGQKPRKFHNENSQCLSKRTESTLLKRIGDSIYILASTALTQGLLTVKP